MLLSGAVGLGLARGLPSLRDRAVAGGLASLGALAGLVIERGLAVSGVLVPIFGPGLSTLIGGGLLGGSVGVGAIGRLLGARSTALSLPALAHQIEAASPDVASLLLRADEAHRRIEGPAAVHQAADHLVRRMTGFAQAWLDIERQARGTRPELLTERVTLLEERLAKTTDPVTVAELSHAIGAVRAQGQALTEILAGRDRATARLEHQVATLERLRFAALRHRSADQGRSAAELGPVLEELAEAGGNYDVQSETLKEEEQVDLDPPST